MHKTRYLLFVVSIIGLANLFLGGNADWSEPDNDRIPKFVEEGMKKDEDSPPDPPKPDTLAPELIIKAPENEDWTLSRKENNVILTPGSDTKGKLNGGPFNGDEFTLKYIQMGWNIDEEKQSADLLAVVYYSSAGDDVIIIVPIYGNGNTDNPGAEKFVKAMQKIQNPGESTPIKSGENFEFFKGFQRPDVIYKYYKSSCYNEETGDSNDNCNTVKLPMLKDSNYMSYEQVKKAYSNFEDDSGNQLETNMPRIGEKAPGESEKKGKGVELQPV